MSVPGNKKQLTAWLRANGYQWILKSPTGTMVSVPEAIRQIEAKEKEEQEYYDEPLFVHGIYPSGDALDTYRIRPCGHDDDTGEFLFSMDAPDNIEENGAIIRYSYDDGTVFIQHDGILETEQEYLKAKPQKAK